MRTLKDFSSENILSFRQSFVQYIEILTLVIYSVVFRLDIVILLLLL